ncbi:AfsR/SARP family transcriptional regulator [Nonomuraea basaltis]|uniref:AfsR/SARP family transcriptional regulator n=1 Tax=Nonomuraea basaltis TaxID=2495887 RepID=UPI00197E992E|nr:tetratricopeptide repeat protein [Nonomuraea basaltis]
MAAIWFGVLGPLEVRADGRPVRLHGPRQERALAALLLDAGQAVTIDRLLDSVWEDPPATARRQVQDLVTRLRRTLVGVGAADDLIMTVRGGYRLRPAPGCLDSRTFDDLVSKGRETAPADAAAAAATFRRALLLWRGEPLTGVGGQRFENAARALQERQMAVWEECLALELSLGRHQEVTAELLALVDRHPFRESLVGLLMRATAEAGRLADALEIYRGLQARLADELGLDPGPELRRQHDALLCSGPGSGEPHSDTTPPGGPVTDRVAAMLPLDAYGFTGRQPELAWLDGVLAGAGRQPTAVVVSAVSGTAGVGKTALAVHWAHRVRDLFPDGQLYVNLRGFDPDGSAMTPAEAVRGFLSALGVAAERVPATVEAQAGLYRSLLAGRRVLIVLDNARDAEQVRPLLPGSSGCVVVVTSRNQLSGLVAAEGALPLPLDLLPAAEARELLARRLGADRVAAEPKAVDEIIARCARLPLALTVVAARAAVQPGFSLASVAGELGAPSGHLDAFDVGDTATQVRGVFSWSYRILGEDVARLFRLLGLHRGPDLGVPAAASLAGVPMFRARSLLAELARAHLVTEQVPGRYAFHDLMRAYAGELVHAHEPATERRAALRRLLGHYLHAAEAANRLLNPHRERIPLAPIPSGVVRETFGDHHEALAWFATEHAVLLAATEQAAGTGFGTHTWQLAWTLTDFLDRRGYWRDYAAVHATALRAASGEGDQAGQAHARRGLGWACTRLAQYDEAQSHYQRALDLYGRLGDRTGQAHTHGQLSSMFELRGRHQDAHRHARQALDLYRATGNRSGQARALNSIGWFHALLGEYEKALLHCGQALTLYDETEDRHGLATTLDSLGYAHHHLGQWEQAVTCYERSLALARELGHRFHTAETLLHLGDTHQTVGEIGAARLAWGQALTVLDELDHHPDAGLARAKLASLPAS